MHDPTKLTKIENITHRRISFERGCLGCKSHRWHKQKFKMHCEHSVEGWPEHTKKTCYFYMRKY